MAASLGQVAVLSLISHRSSARTAVSDGKYFVLVALRSPLRSVTAGNLGIEARYGPCAGETNHAAHVAYLYEEQDDFGDSREVAKRLVKSFEKTMCSIEAKEHAKAAAQLFDLRED